MEISTFEDLYLKLSLYKPIQLNEEKDEDVVKLFSYCDNLQFDCYCPECSKESTFLMVKNEYYIQPSIGSAMRTESTTFLFDRLYRFGIPKTQIFSCQRNQNHIFTYNFYFKDKQLIKTGQYPSMADIEIPSIQKYKNLLKRDYSDFSKAIGLHSHGVGAGSFVYLRRIFENLIEEIHQEYLQSDHWDDDLYQRSRMDDKIKLLQDKLPEVLVENRAIYGIMSKGIHELSEDECLALFPDVKLGIELILDEKLYEQEKQSKRKSFSSFVSTTVAELKS
ncbi:hypothetical protein MHI04_10905 [Lysinibacillus sp. FSL K6-1151]|uniref:hypothetical protein n=1 Tax=Lysinibacillus sp. FSL K6-1151 TaxID=2921465 RepID=UPI00315AE8B1